MRLALSRTCVSLAAGWAAAAGAFAAEPTKEQAAFFQAKIAPLLTESCYKCHSEAEGKTKGGLALDSREGVEKGGDDGKIVDPANPAKSMLLERIASRDPEEKMPPKDATLNAQQIADLTAWVKMGAPVPAAAPSAAIRVVERPNARKHWAWQPVRPSVVPLVKTPNWTKTPVDSFVLARLEQFKLTPSAPADRATLIRRAYFDLIGLPPMPWEVQAFIDDKTPNAWEKVIDKLLASPHYGERWGRYWLDVARYSDTKGDAGKKESPQYVDAWTYRDYVIDAFNRDKPYDRFILEQIAADKLPLGQDKRPLAALGFLTLGDRFNGNKNDVINDRIDVVSKGFLGLTVSCARCHDHMFDPIPQKDYYSLHGIFNSTIEPKENPVIAAQPDAKLYQDYLKARDAAMEDGRKYLRGEMERTRQIFRAHAGDVLMASLRNGADRRPFIEAIGQPARVVAEVSEFIKRASQPIKRHPIFSPFVRFSELPAAKYADKGAALAAEIAGGGDKRFPVNPQIAALFKGKSPQSMEEVAGYYTAFFKSLDAKPAEPVPAVGLASAVSGPPAADAPGMAEIQLAPFPDNYLGEMNDPSEIGRQLPQKTAIRFQQLMAEVSKVELTHPGAPKRAMAVEDSATVTNSPVFIRGEANNKGEVVPHRFLEILSGPNRPEFKNGSGRLDLAEAIASRNNPLTARVMVNRIWMHHFGEGFVTTPDDFGTQSAPPSHPELLDYLANRFMQSGWSVKAMHKLIMMSATYQQGSEANQAYANIDPNNRLLWRFNVRRLDFEPIRDSLLYIAGELDQQLGGHPVNILSEPYSRRRSVYGYIDRRDLPEMMNHFDFANPGLELGKRHETTVPQQALFMMNSPLMIEVSRKLLERPEMAQAHTDAQKVHALYWMIFQRPPKPEETKLGLDYLAQVKNSANPNALPAAEKPTAKPTTKAEMIAQRKADKPGKKAALTLENEGEKVERKPLTAWEKYTHALLMANETIYYN